MNWKILDSEYLYKRPWLTVRKETVLLPNGNTIPEYYVLEYPDWVNVIAITEDGRFVFVKQFRNGLKVDSLELCAGVCEKGEDPMDSAKRELLEETGYGDGEWTKLMAVSANPGTHTNLTHCFLARGVKKISDQNLEPTEDLSVHLLTHEEVLGILERDELKQSLHVAPLWKYFATEGK